MNIVYYLISFLLLLSMSFSIQGNSQNETYIFYFDVNDKNMHKYYAYKNGPLKFLYDSSYNSKSNEISGKLNMSNTSIKENLDKAGNIVFTIKKIEHIF